MKNLMKSRKKGSLYSWTKKSSIKLYTHSAKVNFATTVLAECYCY